MSRSSLYKVLFLALFVFFAALAWAQPNPPGDPCPGGPPCNPDVPITGIEWLIAAGGALGIKFLRDSRKSRKG